MTTPTVATPAKDQAFQPQRVLSIHHYTDKLFKFRLTRAPSFRFRSGEFVMIGLQTEAKPLLRAYSIASPAWDEELEFYSIKAPDGPLTSRLQHIQPGDEVLVARKSTGTLVMDALTPGRRLFLFSTGTGFAPFASLLRDPETYEKFEEVIVAHTCRDAAELAYSAEIVDGLAQDPLVGDIAPPRVRRYDTCTRETHPRMGRITDLLESGKVFSDLSIAPIDPAKDRAMICGSLPMIKDTAARLDAFGMKEGAVSEPADYVIEKAFAG